MERTSDLRGESSRLFISLNKPHNSIATVSIRNIFIFAMAKANIDISVFGPHSARASASSTPGLTLKEILKMGCWKQSSTFKRYYEADLLD
jgi:hypothetical protein